MVRKKQSKEVMIFIADRCSFNQHLHIKGSLSLLRRKNEIVLFLDERGFRTLVFREQVM